MMKILGISGSLRAGSYNSALLRAAAALAPEDVSVEIASIREIPLYDGDVEAAGIPTAVSALKGKVLNTDALLLATPEYNNGVPGVLKNALDWLSRPPADVPRVFRNRPIAIIGATPGGFGTVLAQSHWLPVLRTLGTRPWFGGRLAVSRADKVFSGTGELLDDGIRAQLRDFMQGFCAFVAQQMRRDPNDAQK